MLKVGLTGGICSGKSTVADMLEELGCRVLRLDPLAHELIAPGQPAYQEIVAAFGWEILASDGSIERQKLARVVFADGKQLDRLNAIVHPRVIAQVEAQLAELAAVMPTGIVIVEAALLIESGYYRQLDKLIVTWCTEEQQLARLMARTGLSRAEVAMRLAAQLPAEEKRRYADYEIDCSGSLEHTHAQVEEVWARLQELAQSAAATPPRQEGRQV